MKLIQGKKNKSRLLAFIDEYSVIKERFQIIKTSMKYIRRNTSNYILFFFMQLDYHIRKLQQVY